MAQVTVNPFGTIGTEFSNGLGSMISAIPSSPSLSGIISETYTIVEPIFYSSPSTQVQIELQAIGANAINGYINSNIKFGRTTFNARQMRFMKMLLEDILKIPVLAIDSYLLDVEDNITKSDLTVEEQIPLLIATAIGAAAWLYFTTDVNAGSPVWAAYYISGQAPENYANVPYWVAAATEGALLGYGANVDGLVEPTTNTFSTRMISALLGSLAVITAKVMLGPVTLGFMPRIQPEEVCATDKLNSRLAFSLR